MRARLPISQLRLLYLIAALLDLSVSSTTFAISRRAAELEATALQLGLLGSIWLGVYALCAPISGHFSDRMSRRWMALFGSSLAALSTLACAFTTNIPWLLFLTSVMGIGVGIFWPPIISWVGEGLSGPALAMRMSRFSVSWNVGMFTGFYLSGSLFEIGPAFAICLSAGTLVLIALLLLVPVPSEDQSQSAATIPALTRIPKGRGFRKTAWLSNFAMLFAVTGTLALFPQMATSLGIRPKLHGELLVFHRMAALGVAILWPHVRFWQTRLWPLWIAECICALGVLGVGFGLNVWEFGAALVACGAMLGFNYQASLFFTLEEMSDKGKGSGIHEAMLGAGAFFGPAMAGWVGQHSASLRAPYFFCAASVVFWIAVQMAIVVWRRSVR
jgi:MFS family permease